MIRIFISGSSHTQIHTHALVRIHTHTHIYAYRARSFGSIWRTPFVSIHFHIELNIIDAI